MPTAVSQSVNFPYLDPSSVGTADRVLGLSGKPHGEQSRLGAEWQAGNKAASAGQGDLGGLHSQREPLVLALPYKCVVARSTQRQAGDTKPIQKERNIQLAVQRCTSVSEDQSIARFPQQELFLFRHHGDTKCSKPWS